MISESPHKKKHNKAQFITIPMLNDKIEKKIKQINQSKKERATKRVRTKTNIKIK
jgi:hypothetical protein